MRVAKEFQDGWVVNLGLGIPTLASLLIPLGRTVHFHTENGALGFGAPLREDELEMADINLIDAGGQFVRRFPGMSFFDGAESFAMIRGGHIDLTVLGALQVSERGDLANWAVPEWGTGNIGGGMDLAAGAKRMIVVMQHVTKDGKPKIVEECSYPVTARGCVTMIITDVAVISVTAGGLLLEEIAPGWTAEEIQALTEPALLISEELKPIDLSV
jgi:3-oxoacid CoA-transferase subunit B